MAEVLREGVVAAQMGQWAAPFGITLVADLSAPSWWSSPASPALAVAIYALPTWTNAKEALGYHALFQVLLAGVCGAFLTGDLFNLYVWFEVMLIASFGLLILGRRRGAARRRDQVRDAEPRLDDPVPVGGGPALRDDRHAQHGGPARRGADGGQPRAF
jgi:formate hydrogenlyase subunit 3/multisubunit Na+/H+ antiporter MnhD subunit